MELLKRFVAGVGIGVAVVGLAMFALSVAPQSGAESAAQPQPALPALPGDTPNALPQPVPTAALFPKKAEPLPPGVEPPPLPPSPTFPPPPGALMVPEVKQAKNEVAKLPQGRSAVRFVGPDGMKVSWLVGETFHDRDLTAPASFNFVRGEVYRLRLTGIAKYPVAKFYPTLEVSAPSERVLAFLGHNAIPVTFTDVELATAAEGRLVMKAVYLPGAPGAESATAPEEVSSVRPGFTGDPVSVASNRGSLLAVIRLGNVDLENPNSPPLHAPPSTSLPDRKPMTAPPDLP
ncbi:MAG TPA: hypothetical protein VGE74_29100 [Gemmata sp.]